MKAHVGIDSQTKLIHSVAVTAAKVPDSQLLPKRLHGQETRVWGDSTYSGQREVIRQHAPKAKSFVQTKAHRHRPLSEEERATNRTKSTVRAKVESAFLVIKADLRIGESPLSQAREEYALQTLYAPAKQPLTRETVGTRYFMAMVRTFVNLNDPADVDPISWLIGTASGWGGNPRQNAIYSPLFPAKNDGTTGYHLILRNVPVDGFWSVTAYNAEGFMFENDQKAYSVNNMTAKRNTDGSHHIQFIGEPKELK
ncbi:MAG: DUF1214 domain-containing protein [Thermomicrobiales bacterium]|nr:MAG: DUF1214 domain-containing protein [Thermomicrobiales bacterium]